MSITGQETSGSDEMLEQARNALRAAIRQLSSLRCSFDAWTVGYKEASETIAQCQRALRALGDK